MKAVTAVVAILALGAALGAALLALQSRPRQPAKFGTNPVAPVSKSVLGPDETRVALRAELSKYACVCSTTSVRVAEILKRKLTDSRFRFMIFSDRGLSAFYVVKREVAAARALVRSVRQGALRAPAPTGWFQGLPASGSTSGLVLGTGGGDEVPGLPNPESA